MSHGYKVIFTTPAGNPGWCIYEDIDNHGDAVIAFDLDREDPLCRVPRDAEIEQIKRLDSAPSPYAWEGSPHYRPR